MEVNILKSVPVGLVSKSVILKKTSKTRLCSRKQLRSSRLIQGHVMSFITVKFGGKLV